VDRIDTTTAHPARRYNYWLGGKDNFAADRASGDAIEAAMPTIRLMAVENRMFLGRAVRFLAEQGVDQYLDIGTGIPAPGNTHEVAQGITPSARIVYVVATHSTWEYQSAEAIAELTANNRDGRFAPRTGAQLAALLDGLEFVEPGLVSVSRCRGRDAPQPRPSIEDVSCNGVVARIP
jgi:hypothetical protein